MQLISRRLQGRAFALQLCTIMHEFGHIIPWLEPLRGIEYATNGTYVRDTLLHQLGCREPNDVMAFQLVAPGRAREFTGGVLWFAHSPEIFIDRRNTAITERLAATGYSFVTCLQVRDAFRGQGYGTRIMQQALRAILAKHHKVWGVVSEPALLPWYVSYGGVLQSPVQNHDNLWIVTWE